MRQGTVVPDDPFLGDEDPAFFGGQPPWDVYGNGRQQRGQAPAQRAASTGGGMFAAAAAAPASLQHFEDTDGLFDPAGPASSRRAAAAGVGGLQGVGKYSSGAGRSSNSRAVQQPRRDAVGVARPAASNSHSSGLNVPASMPHRNPSKQLKYRLPAAAAGGVVKKRKKGGGAQTKLCWG